MVLWIVTCVDVGDTCDGKSRVLKVCSTKKEAKQYIEDDMNDYVFNGTKCVIDPVNMSVWQDNNNGCEWNLEEITITSKNIISEEQIKSSEKILMDADIEEDKAKAVLQNIGRVLLNVDIY